MQRTYLAIDLKSYYASAECAARHLDPLTTNLVVADSSRTEKTICLSVSPSLKAYGIPGRARLFEVVQKVKEVNTNRLREVVRLRKAVYKDGKPSFSSASYDSLSLATDPSLELSYLVAPPRMAYYEKVSRQIFGIYLKYIAPEDIVVYSHRRGVHRCHLVLIPLQHDSTRPCHDNDPGSAVYNWHYSHRRDWYESVSGEAGNGHHRQTCCTGQGRCSHR